MIRVNRKANEFAAEMFTFCQRDPEIVMLQSKYES